MEPQSQQGRPVSPAVLYILLALSERPMHGYGIMKEVERQSGREYRMGPGTLYDNLRKLMDEELVEDLPSEASEDAKRLYRLTHAGATLLAAELQRLEQVLRTGRKRLRALEARGQA